MKPIGLADLRDRLATGVMAVDDYVTEVCAAIDRQEPLIRALVPESGREKRLRADARELFRDYPEPTDRPPLYGVAIGVKDIFNVDGLETRAGSALPTRLFAGPEASTVQRLKAVGALILGKTVTTEFAFADPGPTVNPRGTEHTPGGSSSGSAAAVATGYSPAALGSQTVDSIINPASYCGVVGFKPSYGRVPIDGVLPLSGSMDHVGWLSSDVTGSALLGSVLCDSWNPVEVTDPPAIGVPVGSYLDQTQNSALEEFSTQIDRLSHAGVEVARIRVLDDIDVVNAAHRRLIAAEFAKEHSRRFGSYGTRYHAKSASLFAEGSALPPQAVAAGRASSRRLTLSLVATMDAHGIDAWAAPSATGPAPEGLDYIGDPAMSVPWTHAHLPTISLPAGEVDGLPVGLQLIGRPRSDEYLLAVAELLEQSM